jgi:uncharacterized protein
MAQIKSLDALRNIIAEPRASTSAKILDELDEQAQAFVVQCPFLLLATSNAQGVIEVSPKGDEPGFVRIEHSRSLLMPERAGNNLAIGLKNIVDNGRIGLIFLKPQTGETLRISGQASLYDDADLLARLSSAGKPALLAIRITIERTYFHCARAVLRAKLWQPQTWPAEVRVSFGKIIAPRVGGDQQMAEQIDERVSGAYTTRLWRND